MAREEATAINTKEMFLEFVLSALRGVRDSSLWCADDTRAQYHRSVNSGRCQFLELIANMLIFEIKSSQKKKGWKLPQI